MRITYAGDTHVGLKREHNEDSLLIYPEESLFVVADGMGGHASGEIASRLAIDTMKSFFQDTSQDEEITWPFQSEDLDYNGNRLITAIKLGNQRIHESSASRLQLRGMGTTVVALHHADGNLYVAHVGDSRCYRFSEGKLLRLTEDHSLLNDFRRSLSLTPEEERNFPHKNIIVRALGMKDLVDVDMQQVKPRVGELYLLCSDGLCGEVDEVEIERALQEEDNLVKLCHRLVQMANDTGGKDNVTVVLVRFEGEGTPGLDELTDELTREITDEFDELDTAPAQASDDLEDLIDLD